MIAEGNKSLLAHREHFRNRLVIVIVYGEQAPYRIVVYEELVLSYILEQRIVWHEVRNDLEFITFVREQIELKVVETWFISKPKNFTIFTLKKVRVHIIPWKKRSLEFQWCFFVSHECLLVD